MNVNGKVFRRPEMGFYSIPEPRFRTGDLVLNISREVRKIVRMTFRDAMFNEANPEPYMGWVLDTVNPDDPENHKDFGLGFEDIYEAYEGVAK